MQNRIDIIESFKSFLGERKKSIDNRLRYVEILKYFTAAFILLVIIIIIKSLLPFNFLSDKLEWNNSAVVIIFSITYLLHGPRYFYESKLLKHLKTLKKEEKEFSDNETLNVQLRTTINEINDHKRNWFIVASVVIIMIASLIHVIIDDFEYWEYLKIPFLLFIILISFDFLKNYNRLSKNIKEYEEQ